MDTNLLLLDQSAPPYLLFDPCIQSLPKMRYNQVMHTRKVQDEMPQNVARSHEDVHIFIIINLFLISMTSYQHHQPFILKIIDQSNK